MDRPPHRAGHRPPTRGKGDIQLLAARLNETERRIPTASTSHCYSRRLSPRHTHLDNVHPGRRSLQAVGPKRSIHWAAGDAAGSATPLAPGPPGDLHALVPRSHRSGSKAPSFRAGQHHPFCDSTAQLMRRELTQANASICDAMCNRVCRCYAARSIRAGARRRRSRPVDVPNRAAASSINACTSFARSFAPYPSTTCVIARRSPRRRPCGSRANVRVSRKTAAMLAPGRTNRTLRVTESRADAGWPVSRLTTVRPSKNFPRLRPRTVSRKRTYAVPLATKAIDDDDQDSAKIEATSRPSIVAAYSLRGGSTFV